MSMTVSGTRVVTNGATDYRKKFSCADLRNGLEVKVKGKVRSDGALVAQRIEED
jgi:hypothetical protein